MNSFGRMLRVSIFGESHGECVGVVIDGCPAGLPLSQEDFKPDLQRRRPGAQGTTPRKEPDIPQIRSGIFRKKSTGAPILITFENADVRSEDYSINQWIPRPGHADFAAQKKFSGFQDHRGGGYFSGRLTVGLVSAGVIAKKIVSPSKIRATLLSAGGNKDIDTAVQSALKDGDSIGGLIECKAAGLPAGLGEPFFDSVESLMSHIIFSVPGIKGIEFGSGFACSRMRGSECNDVLLDSEGRTQTNHAGGINGGITNGNEVIFRVAVKPPSSIKKSQTTVNLQSGQREILSIQGRHDTCIARRMPVIVEACAALVLADLLLIEQKRPRIVR